MTQPETPSRRVVLVTGPAGAGRSTAINVLEDLGFEAIDNMPLRLIKQLLEDISTTRPLALGIDPRTRGFSVNAVLDVLDQMAALPDLATELLFLDCDTETLLRRFSETRRRHPLADGDRPEAGIQRELDMLRPLLARADVLIDTSPLNVHELRNEVEAWFGTGGQSNLAISVQSFSYKRGLPRSVDMVFDCRFLTNPHWVPALRDATGLDAAVRDHVATDARFSEFLQKSTDLMDFLLPAYVEEGKSHLSIAFGCTGGQHRSVVLAETVAAHLAQSGWQVSIRHRELDRRKKDTQASGAAR